MDFDLEETIRTLTNKYGEKRISRKHGTEFMAIPKERRKDILRHLVNTAKELGQEKEFFKLKTKRDAIFRAVFPDALTENWDNKKIQKSSFAVLRELDEVLVEIWPAEIFAANTSAKKAEEWNPAKQGRLGKPIDKSTLKDAPKFASIQDDEAAELLGFKK